MSRQSKKVVAAVDELTQEEREVGGRDVERGQGHRGGGDHHGVRVAKTCRPADGSVLFFWPVLIFGKSTRKTVLLCPWLISLMP